MLDSISESVTLKPRCDRKFDARLISRTIGV